MRGKESGCPPGEISDELAFRIRLLDDFWRQLGCCDDSGATTREALDQIERQVDQCLYRQVPDIVTAEALTALALKMLTDG